MIIGYWYNSLQCVGVKFVKNQGLNLMLYVGLDVNFSEMVFEVLQLWGTKSMCNGIIDDFVSIRG